MERKRGRARERASELSGLFIYIPFFCSFYLHSLPLSLSHSLTHTRSHLALFRDREQVHQQAVKISATTLSARSRCIVFPFHTPSVCSCVCVYTAVFTFLRLSNNLASTRTRAPPARICSSGGVCLKKIPKLQVNTQRNFVAPRMLCNTVNGLTDHFALPFAYFTAHSYIDRRELDNSYWIEEFKQELGGVFFLYNSHSFACYLASTCSASCKKDGC